jgi:hypothetical protein
MTPAKHQYLLLKSQRMSKLTSIVDQDVEFAASQFEVGSG